MKGEGLDWAKKAEEDFLPEDARWNADLVIIHHGNGAFQIAKDREEKTTHYYVDRTTILSRLMRAGPSVRVYWINAKEMRETI